MKLGILGLKGHLDSILAGIQKLDDVEIVAVSDDNRTRLDAFIQRLPQRRKPQAYTGWLHMLQHATLDVCCVADESGVRLDQLLELLDRNVSIISEKPLVTTLPGFDRLRTAFARSTSRLTMLLEMRYEGRYARMREIVQRGDIGEVCQVTALKSYKWGERPEWFKSRSRLGGTIPYIGIHLLDLIHWITALDFTRAAAFHEHLGQPAVGETENHASVLALLSNGASATAQLDYLRPAAALSHGDNRLRIAGTKGVIEVRDDDNAISLLAANKAERIPFGGPGNVLVEFVKYLRGGPTPRVTANDCFYSTEVALRVRDAADTQTLVSLPASTK